MIKVEKSRIHSKFVYLVKLQRKFDRWSQTIVAYEKFLTLAKLPYKVLLHQENIIAAEKWCIKSSTNHG